MIPPSAPSRLPSPFLCNSAASGALIVGGMAIASRVAAAVAYIGALGGVALAVALGAPHDEVANGLWGYNASLGATAVLYAAPLPTSRACSARPRV